MLPAPSLTHQMKKKPKKKSHTHTHTSVHVKHLRRFLVPAVSPTDARCVFETGGAVRLELQVEERAARKQTSAPKNRKWCRYKVTRLILQLAFSGVPSRRNVTNPGEQRLSNLQVDVLLNSVQRGPYLGCLDIFFFTCKPTNECLRKLILNHSRENSRDNEHGVRINNRIWGAETWDNTTQWGCSWWWFSSVSNTMIIFMINPLFVLCWTSSVTS